jgi:hypothetical protein
MLFAAKELKSLWRQRSKGNLHGQKRNVRDQIFVGHGFSRAVKRAK